MREKIECKIIQDLLPNYIDKVTRKETSMYIEEHIGECKVCKKILEEMQGKLKINLESQEKEINYLKKFHNEMRKLKRGLILLIIIIVYLLIDKIFFN